MSGEFTWLSTVPEIVGASIGFIGAYYICQYEQRSERRKQQSHAASILYSDLKSIEDYLQNGPRSVNLRYSTNWQEIIAGCTFLSSTETALLYRIYDRVYNYNFAYSQNKSQVPNTSEGNTDNRIVDNTYEMLCDLFFSTTGPGLAYNSSYYELIQKIERKAGLMAVRDNGQSADTLQSDVCSPDLPQSSNVASEKWWQSIKKLLPVLAYLVVVICGCCSATVLSINLIRNPFPKSEDNWFSLLGTIASSIVAIAAWKQARLANKINERLVRIEEERDQYSIRPFILIGNGYADCRKRFDIELTPSNLCVCVGGDSKCSDVSVLDLEFINTTDYYARIHYKTARCKGKTVWKNAVTNWSENGVLLPPNEKRIITFYGSDEDFSADYFPLELELVVENRYSERYIEKVDLCIVGYRSGKSDLPAHVHVLSQNYRVSK